MVTVAVLAVIAAIAVPAYKGYIREGHFATMRSTMDGMRTVFEDHRLDNGTYVPDGHGAGDQLNTAQIISDFGWQPTGEVAGFLYTVAVNSNSYDIWGISATGWVRCENRFTTCCDSDGGGAPTAACP
ncbi:MAG: hypothetical protein KDJ33_20485 [Gammaproteobacteria bacterium]|nr:hypothetical protein [Gammaproteobacteria bacterium]